MLIQVQGLSQISVHQKYELDGYLEEFFCLKKGTTVDNNYKIIGGSKRRNGTSGVKKQISLK